MVTATDSAQWPATSVPEDIRQLINFFFTLVESKSGNAGSRLAEEVFAENGSMVTPLGTIVGREAIRRSRDDAWDVMDYTQHLIDRVYAHDSEGNDLLLLGRFHGRTKDGETSTKAIIVRIVTKRVDGKPEVMLYQSQVWGPAK